jgi:hypothetical protein
VSDPVVAGAFLVVCQDVAGLDDALSRPVRVGVVVVVRVGLLQALPIGGLDVARGRVRVDPEDLVERLCHRANTLA